MADSVALLFAANLATIGGHVAEMISIFVYPVIGYFWTRRRRRSPSMDFNIAEDSPRSMTSVEDTMNSMDALAQCIASLLFVLRTLESLGADEALLHLYKGRERFEKLMDEHRSIQGSISTLTEELSDINTEPGDPLTLQATIRMSRRIRLLHLKGEMLSIEARQTKIVYSEVKDVKVAENVDLELGMSNLPLACINNALRLDEGAECVERIEVERDAICRAGSSVTTTTTPHLCPLPAREQLIVETEPITGKEPAGANRSQPEVGNVPTEQLYPPKPLLKFGDKKRPNRPKHL